MASTTDIDRLQAAVPAPLRARRQWLLWRYVERDGKRTKVPFDTAGQCAKSTDPATWTGFDEACARLAGGGFEGLGFVFAPDDPFCGIDLDGALVDGRLLPAAQTIVDAFATYTEVSPSGSGVKLFLAGKKPAGAGCARNAVDGIRRIEVYDRDRFFTVTGRQHAGTPADVEPRQEQLAALCERLWPARAAVPLAELLNAPLTGDASERERRCIAYLERCPDAISGSGGHDATLRAACECWRFGLDEASAWRVMQWFNATKTGGEPWTDKELAHKLDSARKKVNADAEFGVRAKEHAPPTLVLPMSTVPAEPVTALVEPTAIVPADPGLLPPELLRMPGFVSEVMDHCLDTAPYPNPVLAFAGALSLQAFLAGRKVRDSGDNRTNVYILGLAPSAGGKDWPRKLNVRILHEVGLSHCLGDRFASGEGLQDALATTPCMLFQTDEIDGMLLSINKAKDARYESLMGTMLTVFTSSNSVLPMRRLAGKQAPSAIDQPHLVVFGTAIPNHYYGALSERMGTNGYLARNLVLESGPRAKGRDPRILPVPPRVLEAARWWADFRPGTGNLEHWHPVPVIVEHTPEARSALADAREAADAEYSKAEAAGDAVGTTVWGRATEQIRKLALVWAISENHRAPVIGREAVDWAARFVTHLVRRSLYMLGGHAAETPFDADCLRLLGKLRQAPGRAIDHSTLLKRMKMNAKAFGDLIMTLEQRGDIRPRDAPGAGRTGCIYELVGE